MKKRKHISKKRSKRIFRAHAKPHRKNTAGANMSMRGGIRL